MADDTSVGEELSREPDKACEPDSALIKLSEPEPSGIVNSHADASEDPQVQNCHDAAEVENSSEATNGSSDPEPPVRSIEPDPPDSECERLQTDSSEFLQANDESKLISDTGNNTPMDTDPPTENGSQSVTDDNNLRNGNNLESMDVVEIAPSENCVDSAVEEKPETPLTNHEPATTDDLIDEITSSDAKDQVTESKIDEINCDSEMKDIKDSQADEIVEDYQSKHIEDIPMENCNEILPIEKLNEEPQIQKMVDDSPIEKLVNDFHIEKTIDDLQIEMVNDSQTEKIIDDSQSEKIVDSLIEKSSEDSQIQNTVEDSQPEETIDDSRNEKTSVASPMEEMNEDLEFEKIAGDSQTEKVVDDCELKETAEDKSPVGEEKAAEICDMNKSPDDTQECLADKNDEIQDEAISEVNKICEADFPEHQANEDKNDEKPADIPHASDPFDDLLEHKSEIMDMADHHDSSGNMDHDMENDDDMTHGSEEGEHVNIADINHGQGADEEVCLLPDTEREITEADKLKALEIGKKVIDIESTANAYDALTKGIDDPTDLKDEVMDTNDESHVEETDCTDQTVDDIEDESMREIPDAEKENEEDHDQPADETIAPDIIQEIVKIEQTCLNCNELKECTYRMLVDNELKYLCVINCVNKFQESNPDKYTISHKKVTISEIIPVSATCLNCNEEKKCFYRVTAEIGVRNICQDECLQAVVNENIEKYKLRRKKKMISEIDAVEKSCLFCKETKKCIYETSVEGENKYLCDDYCLDKLQKSQPSVFRIKKKKMTKLRQPMLKLKVISNATDKYIDEGSKLVAKTPAQAEAARIDRDRSFLRKCAQCDEPYLGNDKNLSWETMDFCNEVCLGKYQNKYGKNCANCKSSVSMVSLGKYCVRFGYDIRQFCCSACLDEFKKGLKICCYCQKDISTDYDGFLAPVGDQGQFKDFCSQFCVEKFDQMSKNPVPPPVWTQCAVCSKDKATTLEVAISSKKALRLCSEPCFAAFKFVNNIFPDQCRWCKKYFERKSSESYTIYTEATAHCFCSKTCMNVYISNSRHIVPCNWCKVKKYNFDMIKKTLDNGQSMMMCSLNCLTLYQVSVNAVSSRRIKCDQCKRCSQAQYHLTMSDATVRNFCTYQCVMSFQRQYSKSPMISDGDSQAVPTGAPRRTYTSQKGLPVISNVQSLAAPTPPSIQGHATRAKSKKMMMEKAPSPPPAEPAKPPTPPPPPPPKIYNHVILKPPPPKDVKNISTMTKPLMVTKGVSCRPHPCNKEVQTDDNLQRRIMIPIPVPIYVPSPMAMYSIPVPIPVPIPLPIPVPVFIPTTRNSANGIMKEIKKIQDKMPTDPFEAELLMMAEMVAGDKKKSESDSESDEENDDGFSADGMDTGNVTFGEDMLQMALKMANEYEEPAVDLESAMTANTITPSSHPTLPPGLDENNPLHHHQLMLLEQQRAAAVAAAAAANAANRKRGAQGVASPVNAVSRPKRSRRHAEPPPPTHHPPPEPPREPQEKPDANMCLKYTFGVNAWKQWVMTKNAEIEKSSIRRKPFKSEILQLTADELNYSLCLFVKEVRKPNGSEYAPDTIYYLVLGIQQYLFENGRIDNIFTDPYYEKFTECLDEVARKFSVLYNDSQYIVTRVEEEHLWESKQLGAHSPHVLLSTLMFFNTKHFNLVTVEEHMQLSFSHIMKHWKRNPNQPGANKIPGARNVLLRFYPPQSALEANSRKKKVYEQQENEENPLRCPVKLYEFYISKCPESVKTRNDVFYLMPERSCVPDSPVWYSTQPLGREPLSKMLHRVKMVKEINIALLTS